MVATLLAWMVPGAAACHSQYLAFARLWPEPGSTLPPNGRIHAELRGAGHDGEMTARVLDAVWGFALSGPAGRVPLLPTRSPTYGFEAFLAPETPPAAGVWRFDTREPFVAAEAAARIAADPRIKVPEEEFAAAVEQLLAVVGVQGWTVSAQPDRQAPVWTSPMEAVPLEGDGCQAGGATIRVGLSEPALLEVTFATPGPDGGWRWETPQFERCAWQDGVCTAALRAGAPRRVRIAALDAAGNRAEPVAEVVTSWRPGALPRFVVEVVGRAEGALDRQPAPER